MKNILLVSFLSLSLIACDKLKKAEKATENVGEMNEKMDSMNENMKDLKYKMTLAETLRGLLDQNNYEIIDPIAFSTAPWAKGLADEVKITDLLEFADAEFTRIDEGYPVKDVDGSGAEMEYSIATKSHSNNIKRATVSFLSIVAGLLPNQTLELLIEEARNGAYETTAQKLLMLRYLFLKDFKFDSKWMGRTFKNPAMAQTAFDELEKADHIARLDRKSELVFETRGLLKLTEDGEDPNYNVRIDHDELKGQWRRLLRKVDNDQPISGVELGDSLVRLENKRALNQQKVQELKAKIQSKIDYWDQAQPKP